MLDHPTIDQLTDDHEALATIDRVLRNEHCHRCGGLMIQDHCLDVQSDSGEVEVKVLRCCACGELIDPTILRNRMGVSSQGPDRFKHHALDSQGSVHLDKLTSEVIKTWSVAMNANEIQGNPIRK